MCMENKINKNRKRDIILIVDDEEGIRSQLKWALNDEYQVLLATNADEALRLVRQEAPNLIVLDITLTPHKDTDGLTILKKIIKVNSKIKVIIMTGNNNKDFALKSIKYGAHDYYQKPIEIDELKITIKRALYIQKLELENEFLFRKLKEEKQFEQIIGDCPQMREVFDLMKRVVSTNVPVLICGESGTGKELVARAIWRQSTRKDKPFIPVNCGAIPENLLESELFGLEKGASTGVYYEKKGKLELANRGTVFLNEIGELSSALQIKLLRYLQDKEIERVGGKQPISVDVRIISATAKNLEEEIKKHNFRIDLYYRLSIITINLPPLRERGDDVLLLANCFLHKYTKEYNKKINYFDSLAIERMRQYKWHGNVRELENRVKKAVITSRNNIITYEDLGLVDEMFTNDVSLIDVVDNIQKKYIDMALCRTKGNVSKAARELGISRVTLYDLLNRFNIKVNEYRKQNYYQI